jgi:hypothetical protein
MKKKTLNEIEWLIGIFTWFFISIGTGVFIIRTLFPDAPFFMGPAGGTIIMPAMIGVMLIGGGVMFLVFMVYFNLYRIRDWWRKR